MTDESTSIEWCVISGRRCLRFGFCEKLTTEDAVRVIERWMTEFESIDDETVVLVWDCLRMKGYEKEARQLWTAALKKVKPRIESVWLVTNSTLVGMGAAVMSMMSSLKIHTVRSQDDIVLR